MDRICVMPREERLVDRYLTVKEELVRRGYTDEIDWQDQVSFSETSESDFLREAAWVILSSGMRETVVRSKFTGITNAFLFWESSHEIVRNKTACVGNALKVFAHKPKVLAILSVGQHIHDHGYSAVRQNIRERGVHYLQEFDFIGPVTCYHLAKNIGLDVVKPDRHLVRLASSTDCSSPHELCEKISLATGDRLAVVDLVLWRFATIEPLYCSFFSSQ